MNTSNNDAITLTAALDGLSSGLGDIWIFKEGVQGSDSRSVSRLGEPNIYLGGGVKPVFFYSLGDVMSLIASG